MSSCKCFTTLKLNTLNSFVEKNREAFALKKLLTIFQQNICISDINDRNFNETLTNEVFSFEKPGPDVSRLYRRYFHQNYS